MTVRAWLGKKRDHGGGGGGASAQGSMGTWGSSTQPEVVGEAGEGGGELYGPSTWVIAAQSTGEAGDAALRFFLALVIGGEMTGLLLAGLT